MAVRKPIVIGADGLPQQLQTGDSANVNANVFFSGSGTLPTLTLVLLNGTSVFTVTPKNTGDVLAAGEVITVSPTSRLPGGLNISYAIVTAQNQVEIGFSAPIAITGTTMTWNVVAHR